MTVISNEYRYRLGTNCPKVGLPSLPFFYDSLEKAQAAAKECVAEGYHASIYLDQTLKTSYLLEESNSFSSAPSLGSTVILEGGETLPNVHSSDKCKGQFCCIHNPSDHHMRSWPQHWRGDRNLMERTCPHGVGHPDPDDPNPDKSHGCDGCCTPEHCKDE